MTSHALQALSLVHDPKSVIEVRILNTPKGTVSGYFTDNYELISHVERWNGKANVYITLNPVKSQLLSRANNRLIEYAKHTTTDGDILARRWIPIDFDPTRPAGISSTNEEHQAALVRAAQVRKWLLTLGWPDGICADSGNGAHLLYRIDLENTQDNRLLIERFLKALDFIFSDLTVQVDKTTFNASRIWKLYGSVAVKGDTSIDRPHRVAKLCKTPDTLEVVRRELIEIVASHAPSDSKPGDAGTKYMAPVAGFDLSEWINSHSLPVVTEGPWSGGHKWVLNPCPWDTTHTNRAAYIVKLPSGAISAGCHHNGCAGKDWHDLRAIFEPNHQIMSTRSVCTVKASEPVMLEWEPPVQFTEQSLLPCPVEVLPEWQRAFVLALSHSTQTPPDLACMISLSAISTVCAKRAIIELSPDWTEPLNIWTCTPLPSGSRKSVVVKEISAPIREYERAENERLQPIIADAETSLRIAKARLSEAERKAARSKSDVFDDNSLDAEAAECAKSLAQLSVPPLCRLLADDCTPEKLAVLMSEQKERIAVLSPEGETFELMGGRYSEGRPNLEVYLKAHPGDSITVDRIGRPPIHLSAPALTLGLAPQPEVLRGLATKPGFRGRGLLARFLFVLPPSNLGYRDTQASPVPDNLRREYRKAIRRLLALQPNENSLNCAGTAQGVLILSKDARELFEQFRVDVEIMLRPDGELAGMSDWGGKLCGAVARVAGLLHLALHVWECDPFAPSVSAETMAGVIRIGKYLVAHAHAAFMEMGADENTDAAVTILSWVQRTRPSRFTKRELFNALRGRTKFHQVRDLEPGLKLLEDRAFIRRGVLSEDERSAGRPPSPVYDVNPLTQNTQYTQN